MEDFHLEDGSNDKAYFTMVPNIVLNHSSAVDQALYMQMKRFAGEKTGGGYCSASHRTLMSKLQIGPKALKTSLQYLLDHKWIENIGSRKVMTEGGAQDVQIYRVNDIWRMNVEHYKGANESAPLNEGGDERTQGANERSKGGDESAPIKNYKTYRTLGGETPQIVKVLQEDEERPKKESRAKDKEAVYRLFSEKPQPWWIHKQQKEAAIRLFDMVGLEKVRNGLAFLKEHEGEQYFPEASTPFEYEQKLPAIARKAKKLI